MTHDTTLHFTYRMIAGLGNKSCGISTKQKASEHLERLLTYVGVLSQIELVHLNITSFLSLLSPEPVVSLTKPRRKDR